MTDEPRATSRKPCGRDRRRPGLGIHVALAALLPIVPLGSAEGGEGGHRVEIAGKRVVVGEIPYGAYCDGGHVVLSPGAKHLIGDVVLEATEQGVTLAGVVACRPARRDQTTEFIAAKIKSRGVRATTTSLTLSAAELRRGVDVEVAAPLGNAPIVVRIERMWLGTVFGVVSGVRFQLDRETITVVDADMDGRPSPADRVVYGERNVWIPWHRQTLSGQTEYVDMVLTKTDTLVAETFETFMDKDDATVLRAWNDERKNQGVPPCLYDPVGSAHCLRHAEYLETNRLMDHDEDPGKPGFSEEGRAAGLACNISYGGRGTALARFMTSLFHRPQLIDPRDPLLQLGGNNFAFLMGPAYSAEMRFPRRHVTQPQLHPAPGSTVRGGWYSDELPPHPASLISARLGLPVILRLINLEQIRTDSAVEGRLFRVSGDLQTGTRGAAIDCFLCYPNHNAPEGHEHLWEMIALTPLEVLAEGVYEADLSYYAQRPFHHVWRFRVRPTR